MSNARHTLRLVLLVAGAALIGADILLFSMLGGVLLAIYHEAGRR